MDDLTMANRIRRALAESGEAPAGAVSVVVSQGGVTLYGRVKDAGERAAVERIASPFPGVSSTRNLLQIDPEGQEADLKRHRELLTALEADAEIDASEVQISLSGSQAVLWGRVPDRDQKLKVERVARFNHGAMYVRNGLEVAAPHDAQGGPES